MPNDATKVSVGKPKGTGAIFTAPAGTAVPTDGTTPLDAAYLTLGYASEDGVTNAIEADSEEIKAWGGDTVLAPQTSYSETYVFTCIETNTDVLKEYYGADNVTVTDTNITVKHTSEELPAHPWVIEMILNAGRVLRIVIPNGKISERGEIAYVDNEAIGYEMTVMAIPDPNGATAYTYIATPATTPEG